MGTTIEYFLDGMAFADLGIHVESSTGVIDLPKMKAPPAVDWLDYHGKVVDLTAKRYQEREITLNCWLRASGMLDFIQRTNSLCDLFRIDGTTRLMISIDPAKPLVYEVYNEDGIAIQKRWREDKMIGTFALKLKEPDPVKRVIRCQVTDESTDTLTIVITSKKMVNIYWGDGTADQDVYGVVKVHHIYPAPGVYYAIVAGVIEEIADFDTNGIVIWNKL